MTNEPDGARTSLMGRLKADTASAHERLHHTPYAQALSGARLPLESYVGHLRALAVVHSVLEEALSTSVDPAVKAVWQDNLRKFPLLQQDLRFFEPRVVADIKEAVEESLKLADRIRLQSVQQPPWLLGVLYVLEGSTLGARVLMPQVAKNFSLTGTEGLAYMRSYVQAVHGQWTDFSIRMNDLDLSPEERDSLIAGAQETFEAFASVFDALYPFKPESRSYDVTSLNPEAGRHPVPADAREVEASLRAGLRCWSLFPYYDLRYGERGRRFTRSDGAWLATLYKFEPDKIGQQLRWLGRVLATRGMPTILLEAQLGILFEELSAAVPERRSEYLRILQAAEALAGARARRLDNAQLNTLGRDFNDAVGPEWSARYKNAGELLAAAWVDEMEGSEGAVENIRIWMTDPARFPPDWIAAVHDTLNRARALAASSAADSTAADPSHD